MALAQPLVEMVIAKMTMVYGMRFRRSYPDDVSPAVITRNWADELDGVSAAGITYALEHLPADYVPNVLQFRALAANRPTSDAKALPAPKVPPALVKRHLDRLQGLRVGIEQRGKDPVAWAQRIVDHPEGRDPYVIALAMDALRIKGRMS